jgi:hypothetical protein
MKKKFKRHVKLFYFTCFFVSGGTNETSITSADRGGIVSCVNEFMLNNINFRRERL